MTWDQTGPPTITRLPAPLARMPAIHRCAVVFQSDQDPAPGSLKSSKSTLGWFAYRMATPGHVPFPSQNASVLDSIAGSRQSAPM